MSCGRKNTPNTCVAGVLASGSSPMVDCKLNMTNFVRWHWEETLLSKQTMNLLQPQTSPTISFHILIPGFWSHCLRSRKSNPLDFKKVNIFDSDTAGDSACMVKTGGQLLNMFSWLNPTTFLSSLYICISFQRMIMLTCEECGLNILPPQYIAMIPDSTVSICNRIHIYRAHMVWPSLFEKVCETQICIWAGRPRSQKLVPLPGMTGKGMQGN